MTLRECVSRTAVALRVRFPPTPLYGVVDGSRVARASRFDSGTVHFWNQQRFAIDIMRKFPENY